MSTLTFHGNLAQDPELIFLPDGTPKAELVVIENRRRKNTAGEWVDVEPNRFRVKVYRQMAEHAAETLTTGAHVTVVGTIKTDRWEDKDTGQARTAQHVDADDVSVSLRYQTAHVTNASARGHQPTEN